MITFHRRYAGEVVYLLDQEGWPTRPEVITAQGNLGPYYQSIHCSHLEVTDLVAFLGRAKCHETRTHTAHPRAM